MDTAHMKNLCRQMNHAARKIHIISWLQTLDPVMESLDTLNLAADVMVKRMATGVRTEGVSDEWIVQKTGDGLKRLKKTLRLRNAYGDLDAAWHHYAALFSICGETIARGMALRAGNHG